ncbi:PAS domain S-box protein [Natronomonas sp. CBA1123]|uniref:PAS domain S-box protein n=1 Tax=Natronomonas sp. CBA1123 TaxID=2668070 RepID=UPI0012EADE75|nr:PAS domain S-box protein [Natronomonas sp. CBA1123]
MQSLTVTYLQPTNGSRLEDESLRNVSVQRADSVAAVDHGTDCVLLAVHDDWSASVEELRHRAPNLPIVVVGEADPEVGALASRLGVEYAPTEAFEDREETLTERVHEIVDGEAARVDRNEQALRDLHALSTGHGEFEEKLERILEVGREYLDLDIGFATSIDTGERRLEMLAVAGDAGFDAGDVFPLEEAYCKATVRGNGLLAITDATDRWRDDPAYDSDLRCYLGGTLSIDGETYGTVCFGGAEPRDVSFTESERTFVELLIDRASYELERERREAELQTARDEFETVLERIDDGFFALDTAWRITYVNDGGYEVLNEAAAENYSKSDLSGRNLWETIPDALGTAFEEHYRRAMETQQPESFEAYYEPLDAHLGVEAYPSEEGLSVFFRDVTEKRRRERALNDLHSTTRELMSATTRTEIAEIISGAAGDILGLSFNAVRLYDDKTDRLVPAALSERATEEMESLPTYVPGEGLSGTAFQRQRTLDTEEHDRPIPDSYGPIRAAVAIPIGRHGTLSIGTENADGIDAVARSLANILAANAEAAFDRTERETQLEQYRAVHESVRESVFVIDADGDLRLVTDPLAETLGLDPDTLIGRSVEEFLTATGYETGELLLADLHRTDRAESRSYETTLLTVDGEELPVEIELSQYPGDELLGSVGVVRDRSELEAERARFENLFEQSPDAITDATLTDDGPIIRDVNRSFEETFGVEKAEAVGQSTNDLIVPEDDRPEAERLDELDPEALTEPIEVSRQTPNGVRTFLFRGVYYGRAAEGPRAFGIYTDISDRKADQRRIEMLNRVLRHNLRNTIGVVQGYLDLLRDGADGETLEYIDSASDAAEQIAAITENVRDIERTFDADRRDIDYQAIDLMSVLDEAIERANTENTEATFRTDVDGVTVYDDDLLQKAIAELVENAALHAGDAPIVTVRASADDEAVTIRIEDDGPGVPERERQVVSGKQGITQLDHSRGLGLWLAHYVVESLDGSLSFDDDHDGAAVVLELPRPED